MQQQKKISELNAATKNDLSIVDFLPIVNAEETKRLALAELFDFSNSQKRGNFGRSMNVYISAENGNDDNINSYAASAGNTATTPIKTVNKLLEIVNANTNTEYNIFLMGDSVYEIPSDIFVLIQACPHFFTLDGSPTLKFKRTAGSARFYSARLHLEGTEENRLKIDADYGSFYVEHCAAYAKYVDFLVPVGFWQSSINISNCSFNDNLGSTTRETDKWGYQLIIRESTGIIHGNIEFIGEQGIQGCLYARNSHLSLGYKISNLAVTIHRQSAVVLYASHFYSCTIYLGGTFTYTGDNANEYTTLISAEDCIINAKSDLFSNIKTFTNDFSSSAVFQNGKQVIPNNSITIANLYTTGFVSLGGADVRFSIDLPFCVKDSALKNNGVTFAYDNCVARGVDGYIDSTEAAGTTAYTIEYNFDANQQNKLDCKITLPNTKQNIVNNTPVQLYFKNMQITFS